MENIQQIIEEVKKRVEINPPPHERAYWIKQTADMLEKPFMQVLGVTKDWPTSWIKEFYLYCVKVDNPARFWWGLIKKSKTVYKSH